MQLPGAPSGEPIRLLTFSTLYPNAAQPNHGIFVENRLVQLVDTGAVVSTVLAPVPYVPRLPLLPARWAAKARIPLMESRRGLTIRHPRYVVIPRIGMSVAATLLARTGARAARALMRCDRQVDLIDAHYMYPDGVAAVRIGRALGLPVVVTARGSDITQLPAYAGPRAQIRWALHHADALIAVSAALAERMVELGADRAKVHVLRNGVDLSVFRPLDRHAARAALGLGDGKTLISVGHLIARKGHDRVIAALTHLRDCSLLIVGDGPERGALEALAHRLGVQAQVRFLGSRPHEQLAALYNAADLLVLASSREGWANVLLESMACGTPVVASPIPGNGEVVRERDAGVIAAENTVLGIASAVSAMFADMPARAATRRYAERFGWGDTSAGQLRVFRAVLDARRRAAVSRRPGADHAAPQMAA